VEDLVSRHPGSIIDCGGTDLAFDCSATTTPVLRKLKEAARIVALVPRAGDARYESLSDITIRVAGRSHEEIAMDIMARLREVGT
jgi:hypothetical protein